MQAREQKIATNNLTVDTNKKLGNGEAGNAYLGELTLNKQTIPVAIKILNTDIATPEEKKNAKRQFKRERILFELLGETENIIKYYGHTTLKGQFAIVMQFANQGDLATVFAKVIWQRYLQRLALKIHYHSRISAI